MKWPNRKRKGLLDPRHSTSKKNERLDSERWINHQFDQSTGQIFTERTASILNAEDRDWTRRTRLIRGRDLVYEQTQSENEKAWEQNRHERVTESQASSVTAFGIPVRKGARMLQNVALESAVQNIQGIDAESLENLPPQLIRRLWELIRRRCAISLDTWITFSKYLHEGVGIQPELLKYTEHIEVPQLPLLEYTTPLISKDFSFLVSLSLTASFHLPNLVKLSSIPNLGVLEIINPEDEGEFPFTSVGDRVVRAWQQAATKNQAFSALRVLKLWNHEELTNQSLKYLNGFPSLAVYDVQGCGFDKESGKLAEQIGWKRSLKLTPVDILEEVCEKLATFLQAQHEVPHPNSVASPPLSEGVIRIPRTQIENFIAGRKPSNQENNPKMIESATEFLSWDMINYKTYSLVGELRNDTDLARAGVTVYDQAILGDRLLTSMPMASIRLGPTPGGNLRLGGSKRQRVEHPLFFIRVKAPSAEPKVPETSLVRQDEVLGTSGTGEPANTGVVAKKAGGSMLRNKRRKLDDVLGSFT